MNYPALVAIIMLVTTNTYAFEGKIVNSTGMPIEGATIETTTSKNRVVTNQEGHFKVADDAEELHIIAPGYSHRIVHLHELGDDDLVITLSTTVIEQVDVIGLPIHASVIESAMPVAVLRGDTLRDQKGTTLGDILERIPGVNTNFHGNVASTPVIRGLSGPRVLVTQNGLDVGDQSRIGPDHAIASEVSTAQQLEILRGPATLFYGSGAIGGVVNVVDHRVPNDSATRGEVMASHDTVNSQNLTAFNAVTGTQSLAFYADGFWRDADDSAVPVVPEEEEEEHEADHEGEEHDEDTTVANSAEESSGFTLGTSYLLENGFVGLALERFDRQYGIPGHSHGGHADEDEEAEERIYAELEQNRYQLQSELTIDSDWLRAINTRAAYTDYTHAEIEGGVVGTVFSNKTSEVRLDLFHQEWDHWKGGVNFHYKRSEVAAEGEEAFTPPSTTETLAIAFMEEKHIGPVLLQFGARAERVTVTADNVLLPALEAHAHVEEESDSSDDHDHEEEHEEEDTLVYSVEQDFTPISASLGAVWDFAQGYNLGFSLSHAQRAPSASELLSFGPHIGTRTYEIGAFFDLHEDDGEAHFELSESGFELETSNNIDLIFRKHEGNLGIILNVFFNQIGNYHYQQATGLFAEAGHEHEDEHDSGSEPEGEEEHEGELPIYLFTHEDAEFYGLEAQLIWKLNESWETTFFSDFVRAELKDGRYLPRTPPLRFGADVHFTQGDLRAHLGWTHYTEQDKVAELESTTEGYDMLDASVSYHLPFHAMDLALFIKAENLTDTEARVHTSFIKDVAPKPGRNFSFGIRGAF